MMKNKILLTMLTLVILVIGFFVSPLFHKATEESVKNKIIILQNASPKNRPNNFLAQVPLNNWRNSCESWLNDINDNVDWTIDYYYEMLDNPVRAKKADNWLKTQIATIQIDLDNYKTQCTSKQMSSA